MSVSGLRSRKAPSRATLASVLAQSLPVLTNNTEYLHTEIATLKEQVNQDIPLRLAASTAVLRRSLWGRLTWLVTGR